MAHVREEGTLCFIGAIRVSERFFKERLLFELFANLLIDIAQAYYDEVFLASTYPCNAQLAILDLAIRIGAVDAVEAIV